MARYYGDNSDNYLVARSNDAVIGLGGNDFLTATSRSGIYDQILMGGNGNDTYYAPQNASTVIIEKGNGYDAVNFEINEFSYDSYFYTVNNKHLVIGQYSTGCYVLMPDFNDFSIEKIHFSSGNSYSSKDLYNIMKANGKPDFSPYTNDITYLLNDISESYAAFAETPANINLQENNSATPGNPNSDAVSQAIATYFNEAIYLQNKTDALNNTSGVGWTSAKTSKAIQDAGMSAWDHYHLFGAYEVNSQGQMGIDPSDKFDTSSYYDSKQQLCINNGEDYDVQSLASAFQKCGLDPITHYALYGKFEGVQIQGVNTVDQVENAASV